MTSKVPFTFEEKLDAVRRELHFRRRVYPKWVEAGRMTQQMSDRQLALFEEIQADYEKAVQNGRLL